MKCDCCGREPRHNTELPDWQRRLDILVGVPARPALVCPDCKANCELALRAAR